MANRLETVYSLVVVSYVAFVIQRVDSIWGEFAFATLMVISSLFLYFAWGLTQLKNAPSRKPSRK